MAVRVAKWVVRAAGERLCGAGMAERWGERVGEVHWVERMWGREARA